VRGPLLYAVLTSQNSRGTVYYMVTEYIDGFTLSAEKFLSMPSATEAKLIASLSDHLCILRSIPAPDYYSHVHKQGWRPYLYLLARHTFTTMCGPYETYDAVAQAAYNAAELSL
jgi:serine/threonine protein kinase